MSNSENLDKGKISELRPSKKESKYRVYFGFFDARDSSLLPFQIILFIFALIETVQAIFYIFDESSNIEQHIYAHLGSYMLAYAAALFAIAIRPARAKGLFILILVATIGFTLTSILDIVRGNADAIGEYPHVTKLIGPLIVWIISKRVVNFSSPRSNGG
jgi:hypothetical protein